MNTELKAQKSVGSWNAQSPFMLTRDKEQFHTVDDRCFIQLDGTFGGGQTQIDITGLPKQPDGVKWILSTDREGVIAHIEYLNDTKPPRYVIRIVSTRMDIFTPISGRIAISGSYRFVE